MKTETFNNGLTDLIRVIADEGKVLRRKGTSDIYGSEVVLGKSYYADGEKLDKPHTDTPEDFEEIDEPQEEGYVED